MFFSKAKDMVCYTIQMIRPLSAILKDKQHQWLMLLNKSWSVLHFSVPEKKLAWGSFIFLTPPKGNRNVSLWHTHPKNTPKPLTFLSLIRHPPHILCFTLWTSRFPLFNHPYASFRKGCHHTSSTLKVPPFPHFSPVKFNGELQIGCVVLLHFLFCTSSPHYKGQKAVWTSWVLTRTLRLQGYYIRLCAKDWGIGKETSELLQANYLWDSDFQYCFERNQNPL